MSALATLVDIGLCAAPCLLLTRSGHRLLARGGSKVRRPTAGLLLWADPANYLAKIHKTMLERPFTKASVGKFWADNPCDGRTTRPTNDLGLICGLANNAVTGLCVPNFNQSWCRFVT